MYISKVSTMNFQAVNPKAAVKTVANKTKQTGIDFSKYAYGLPEHPTQEEVKQVVTPEYMIPKQINVNEILSKKKDVPAVTQTNVVLDSSII